MLRANVLCVLTLGLGASLAAGCVDNPTSIQIRQNNVPEEGCVIPGELSDAYRSRGTLDVTDIGYGGLVGYLFTPAVVNGLTAAQSSPNDNIFLIQGARVELTAVNSADSEAVIAALEGAGQNKIDVKTSGSIQPGGGSVGMAFEIIDRAQVETLRTALAPDKIVDIVADVQVYGTVDGGDVSSNHFYYPLTVCLGCRYENLGDCSTLAEGYLGASGGTCGPLMDGFLECCNDVANNRLVCPAVGPTATP